MTYPGLPPFDPAEVLQFDDELPPTLNVSETALGGMGIYIHKGVLPDIITSRLFPERWRRA